MFYLEDVVEVKQGLQTHNAVVTRCWTDEQDPEAAEEALRLGISFVPLPPGALEILYSNGIRTEISESLCTVVDRGFLTGDIIKSSTMNTHQSGVIINLNTEVGLSRVLSGEILDGLYDAKLLVAHARISRGDHVTFNNLWIGLVEEVFEMAMVETSSHLRRICDVGNTLSVGTSADSLLFDQGIPAPSSPGVRRVREVRQIVCAVNWICMNQSLESEEQTTTEGRPKRYWSNTEISQLSLVRATADHLHSIGDKVVFRDLDSNPPSFTTTPLNNFSGEHVLYVTSSRSKASVLWQDGTTTHDISTPLLEHYTDLSEDDAFPGEVGVFTPTNKVAIVQSVNTKKRTLFIRIYGSEEVLEISAIDFDPHGTPEYPFGVRRQEFVLVSRKDTGVPSPAVPKLGESEVLTGSFPSPEMLREEISTIGLQAVNNITGDSSLPRNGHEIEWYGEVIDLQLDGLALIKYPSGKTEPIPLSRLYHVDDGLDPNGPDLGEEDYVSDDDMIIEGSGEEWSDEEHGEERYRSDDQEMENGWADESLILSPNNIDSTSLKVDSPVVADDKLSFPMDVPENENWKSFVIMEEPPLDHHFVKEPIVVPPKAYMSRIKKEYDVFSSLPANILVRAYENRTDLLRVLIIGPSGTPFANAPFLFDIFLPPSTFPLQPPTVFFHSWCGNTKCSPNLYTDGKVCLSLLNTWPGEKVESWSAARSSILQILISIQSLIMVEAPYITEPGFEKSLDTVDGQAASNLYSERTYVLTRMFVKRACEFPPLGFEEEIKAFYFDGLLKNNLGVLKLVIQEAKSLLAESEEVHGKEEEAIKASKILVGQSVFTEGACLSLKRIVVSLIDIVVPS